MAHDYVIISDATCNLPKQFYEDDFAIIPMDVIIDGKAYDADTLSKKEFYDKMRAGVFRPRRLSIQRPQSISSRRILKKVRTCFSFAFRQNFRARLSRLRKPGKNFWKGSPTGEFA